MNDKITIRPASEPRDYFALQEAQRAAWGIADDAYVVPIATLVGANRHGGLVLGAFLPDGRAVGVSFAFLGRVEGVLCLYSQLTGIVPEAQDKGIGTRLKLAQRDFALRVGLPAIAWAFDPLQLGNARFNLSKLGARGVQFYENLYGERSDALNTGAATDRMLAWWPVSPRPRQTLAPESARALRRLVDEHGGEPCIERGRCFDKLDALLIAIPSDVSALRRQQPARAAAWALAYREVWREVFQAGWQATDVVALEEGGSRRHFYKVEPR